MDVWHNFFNLSDNLFSDNLNFFFRYSLDFSVFDSDFYNFLDFLNDLNNFLDISFNWNNFFNYSVDWNWDLYWYSIRPFSFEELGNFMDNWNNSINKDLFGDLYSLLNNSLIFFFDNINSFNNLFNFNDFLDNFFNNLRLGDVSINWDFNFFDSVLIEWHLNHFFNFNNLGILDNSIDNFLNYLGNFYDFFDDSRDNHNFLNDLLDFNNFWYFNHLFNDFININSHLFDSFNSLGHLDNLFDENFDWVINIHIDSCWLFNLNDFGDFNNPIN